MLVLEIIGKELDLHLLVSLVGRGRRLAIFFSPLLSALLSRLSRSIHFPETEQIEASGLERILTDLGNVMLIRSNRNVSHEQNRRCGLDLMASTSLSQPGNPRYGRFPVDAATAFFEA